MGLGSQQPRKKIFYMSIRATKDKKTNPHFITQTREDGKTITLPDETAVSGYLIKIAHGEYEYPEKSGKMVPTISMFLVDGGAMFKIESSVNTNMARGLMNKIISITNWEFVELRLYIKDEFPNLWVGNNGESMGWKYDYKKELEPLVKTIPDPQDAKGVIKIYHDVNAKLLNEWIRCEKLVIDNAHKNPNIVAAVAIGDNTPQAQGKPQAGDGPPEDTDDSTAHLDTSTQENIKDFVPPPTDDDLPF